MSEQTSVDVLLQNLANIEQLTGEGMRELIRDLENLKGELSEPRYIYIIDRAIDVLHLQLEWNISREILEKSLEKYRTTELLTKNWESMSMSELGKEVWQNLRCITEASYQLEDKSLIKQYAEPLLRQLNIYFNDSTDNPEKHSQEFSSALSKACKSHIYSLQSSENPEHRNLMKFYESLLGTMNMLFNNMSTFQY